MGVQLRLASSGAEDFVKRKLVLQRRSIVAVLGDQHRSFLDEQLHAQPMTNRLGAPAQA